MGREVKRVPVDFKWPIGEVWSGFLMPENLHERKCSQCDATGYGPEAWAIAYTFYPHMIGGDRERSEALAWHDKIGQAEVDHLVEKGRLRVWRDGAWRSEPRTADEVNAQNRRFGMDSHDAINRMYLVDFRCEALGIERCCKVCNGHGYIEAYEGQREAAEAWEGSDPPTGDGWQVWETVSEGSPISPVFAEREQLIDWLMSDANNWGISTPLNREAAENFVNNAWAPTMVASARTGLIPGDQFVSAGDPS